MRWTTVVASVLIVFAATPASAQLSYNPGLLEFLKNDPGFDSNQNVRWNFTATGATYGGNTSGTKYDTGHFRWGTQTSTFGGRVLTSDSPSVGATGVKVSPGDSCQVRYWWRSTSASSGDLESRVSIKWYNVSATLLSIETSAAFTLSATNTWDLETFAAIAPATAESAVIQIQTRDTTTASATIADLDGVDFTKTSADTPNPPSIVDPDSGAETTTPRVFFDWVHNDTEADPQARFWIQIATASSFTAASIVREETQTTATTSWTSDTLPRVVVDTLYWRVRTSNSGDNFSDWSTTETFVAKLRPPGAPTLLSPVAAAETTALRPFFRWQFSDSDGNAQSGFVIEITTSYSFSYFDRVETVTTSDSFYTITADLDNSGTDTYFWRVRVFDAAGTSPNSSRDTFVKRPYLGDLNHFHLTESDPVLLVRSSTVRRGQPFHLTIRAEDSNHNLLDTYTGTVTISVARGSITPTSVAFLDAWDGETTVRVTISGDSAVGLDTITVLDGSVSETIVVVPLLENRIVINELLPVDTNTTLDRDEWVELYNRSTQSVAIGGWVFTDSDAGNDATLPALTVPSAKFVVVHVSQTGTNETDFSDTDGAAHLYPYGSRSNRFSGTTDDAMLYASSTMNSATIVSYVAWDPAPPNATLKDTDAVGAGIWQDNDAADADADANANVGRTTYRLQDGSDTNRNRNDFGFLVAADTYQFTEGYSNDSFVDNLTGVSIALTSGSGSSDTVGVGETLTIVLSASGGGSSTEIEVTTVLCTGPTDTLGIVATLREENASSNRYWGRITIVDATSDTSNDGMGYLAAIAGETIGVRWILGGATGIATVILPLDYYSLSCPERALPGDAFSITVQALTAQGTKKKDYTGTSNVTVNTGSISPTSIVWEDAWDGETTATFTISGVALGNTVTITFTDSVDTGDTGTCQVFMETPVVLSINEWLPQPGAIDWNGNGTVEAQNDEWVEIYNPGTSDRNLNGWKMGDAAAPTSFTFGASDTVPAGGVLVVFSDRFAFVLNDGADSIFLIDNTGDTVDSVSYTAAPGVDRSRGRTADGGTTFQNFAETPPRFRISAPAIVTTGTAFTLVETAVFPLSSTTDTFLTGSTGAFNETAVILVDKGTISPSVSQFVAGETQVSVTITGVCEDTVTITVRTGSATTAESVVSPGRLNVLTNAGTVAVFVQADPGGPDADTSKATATQAVADGIDTAVVQVTVRSETGGALVGNTVTITSSKGAADVISPADGDTALDSSGVATFTVTSTDTTVSTITVQVTSGSCTVTLAARPKIYWVSSGESGLQGIGGGLSDVQAVLVNETSASAGRFALYPVWRRDGRALAWLRKADDEIDTWTIYVAFDDGAHGDGAAEDGTFSTPRRVTGLHHHLVPHSRPAWKDVLNATGARGTDGVDDVLFSARNTHLVTNNATKNIDIGAVRADGSDSTEQDTDVVWMLPSWQDWTTHALHPGVFADGDTIVFSMSGRLYRLNASNPDATFAGPLTGPTSFNALQEPTPYDSDVVAAWALTNAGRGSRIYVFKRFHEAGPFTYSGTQATDSRWVVPFDNADTNFKWNLSWDSGGDVVSFARDRTGTFNYLTFLTSPDTPDDAFVGADFDVRAAIWSTANDTFVSPTQVNFIAAGSGRNDIAAAFSHGNARLAYVTQAPADDSVQLKVLDIDGAATVDASGGVVYENGRMTVVVDEGDVQSGSFRLRVSPPQTPPTSDTTSDSIILSGAARDFFPEGQRFADSITVRLYYDAADLAAAGISDGTADEYRMRAFFYRPSTGQWVDYGGVVNPTNGNGALGYIEFQTTHFSRFAPGLVRSAPLGALEWFGPRALFRGETAAYVVRAVSPAARVLSSIPLRVGSETATVALSNGVGTLVVSAADTGRRFVRSDSLAGAAVLVVLPAPWADTRLPTGMAASRHGGWNAVSVGETEFVVVASLPGVPDTSGATLIGADSVAYGNPDTFRPTSIFAWTAVPRAALGDTSAVGETAVLRIDAPAFVLSGGDTARLSIPVRLFPDTRLAATLRPRAGLRVALPESAAAEPFVLETETSAADGTVAEGLERLPSAPVVEIVGRTIAGDAVETFAAPVVLVFEIPAEFDGEAADLRIARLTDGAWVVQPTTTDTDGRTVSAPRDHLSIYTLLLFGQTLAPNLQNLVAYPNPWRANVPTGALDPSNALYGLKFDGLTAEVTIRIYTVAGERVLEGRISTTSGASTTPHLRRVDDGLVSWDLRNQSGRDVASGVYLVQFENGADRTTRKVAVVR